MLVPAQVTDLMQTSDVVGNIRFTHPTLYIFPGGQGDSALFGINGFNMLGKETTAVTNIRTILNHVLPFS